MPSRKENATRPSCHAASFSRRQKRREDTGWQSSILHKQSEAPMNSQSYRSENYEHAYQSYLHHPKNFSTFSSRTGGNPDETRLRDEGVMPNSVRKSRICFMARLATARYGF